MSPADGTPYPKDFKPEVGSPETIMDANEKDPGFFTTPGTQAVSALLSVKRYTNGINDNICIERINRAKPTRFKFPSTYIPVVVKRLNEILGEIKCKGKLPWELPGVDKVSTWDDFTTDEFWQHKHTFHVGRFWVRPYLTISHKIMFRIWQEVDAAYQRTYENDKGFTMWRGPAASLNYEECKDFVSALERLEKMAPEVE